MNGIIEGERKKERLPRGEKKKLGNGKRGNLASVTRQENLLLLFLFLPFCLLPRPWNEREREIERENLAGVTNFCCEKFYHSHDGIPPFAHHLPFSLLVTSLQAQFPSSLQFRTHQTAFEPSLLFSAFIKAPFSSFPGQQASKQTSKQTGSRSKKAHAHAQQKKNLAGPGHKARRPSSD